MVCVMIRMVQKKLSIQFYHNEGIIKYIITICIFFAVCYKLYDSGTCRMFEPRYFYLEDTNCEIFLYGNCGGNENNFRTIRECEETCKYALKI